MERLCGFKRARSTAEAYIKRHFAHLVFTPPGKKRVYRRFRRASIGEPGNMTAPFTSGGRHPPSRFYCSPLMIIPASISRDASSPPTLLDLHLSRRSSRRVNNDHTIDFEGHNYEISATKRKTVTIVHHPSTKFRVLAFPPKTVWPTVHGAYTL